MSGVATRRPGDSTPNGLGAMYFHQPLTKHKHVIFDFTQILLLEMLFLRSELMLCLRDSAGRAPAPAV